MVGGDDEVELHGAESAMAGLVEGVEAHGPGDSAALRGGGGGVAAVGDVGACSGLVGLEVVGSDDAGAVIAIPRLRSETWGTGDFFD